MANNELTVYTGLDLGSDTLKIAYAYDDGGLKTGKIVASEGSATAIPAVAYYDAEEGKWLFGEEVDGVGDKSFMSVVKIKGLLSLLLNKGSAEITARNTKYFFEGNHFPKFYFPVRRKLSVDFEEAVKQDMTFKVSGITPEEVCLQFFGYVYSVVCARAKILAKRCGASGFTVIPSAVYPQHTCKAYIDELKNLIRLSFSTEPQKVLSMTKALCVYAMQTGRINRGESVLIFNIGEERVSVVKASLFNKGLAVDGADGHNDPEYIGGNDIDDAVANYLERGMSGRESMGRPSSGEDGHMAEGSLNSKQYLFVRDIKTAKVIFGMPVYDKGVFKNGVPVCVSRDLYIQRSITREQFTKCLGLDDGSGVAGKLLDYIERELDRHTNSDVRKIFFTGGPVETYGLVNFLRERLSANRKISVYTFENEYDGEAENDGFNILQYEDALYAPSLGCAIADLNGIEVETVLALSYGLRLFLYEGEVPYLELLVNRGDVLPPEGAQFITPKPRDKIGLTTSQNSINSAPMYIMSTVLTRSDIDRRALSPKIEYVTTSAGKNYLKADPFNKRIMANLANNAGLKILSADGGGNGAGVIYYYYNKTRVRLIEKVYAVIGVDIDGEGRARPYCRNDKARNGNDKVTIIYLWDIKKNGKLIRRKGQSEVVYKRDIVFDFDIGEMIFN
ncbi:MAG: hypothetical protein K2N30_01265 [Clostridia bacterium]|nr:hypothetical protein [Clostridia bacterium]